MIARREALLIVAGFFTRWQAQRPEASGTCRLPSTLVLDLGNGACSVTQIRVQQGALSATIPTTELLSALGATLGG